MQPFIQQHWVQTATLLLRRQQLYALTIILTLGLTLGALVATFNLNYQLFMAPLPYPNAERLQLVRGSVWQQDKQLSPDWLPSQAQLDIYRQPWAEIETKALHNIGIDVEQSLPGHPSFNVGYVTPEFLPMFDAPLALGRHLQQDEGLDSKVPVAILSYQVWQQHFAADPAVLDKTLQFKGVSFKVVGVLAKDFVEPVMASPGWFTEVWLSYDFHDAGPTSWDGGSDQMHLLLKLVPTADPSLLAAGLAHSLQQWATPEFNTANGQNAYLKNSTLTWRMQSLRDRILGDASLLSVSLLAGSALLCAIALANIANLVLSRALAQQHSLTIRIALGAKPADLFRQYLTELSLLAIPALLLCLLVAEACYQSLKAGYAGPVPRLQELGSSTGSLLLTFSALLLWCVLLATWLSRQLNYRQLQQNLQQSGKGSAVQVSGRTRQLLLMSQTLFCLLTLIYCSQIFVTAVAKIQQPSGVNLQSYQVALNPGALLASMADVDLSQLFIQALEQVKTQTNASKAGLGNAPPISYWQSEQELYGVGSTADNETPSLQTQVYQSDGDYLQALGLELVQGNFFSQAQVRQSERVMLISESLAKQLSPDGQVLDKPLYFRGASNPRTIIGVVKDLHLPNQTGAAAAYIPVLPNYFPTLVLTMPTGQTLTREQVNLALAQVNPQLKVFRFDRTSDIFAEHTKDARVAAVVTAALSLLALALAGLGIFAVIRTQIQLRQYELAVRQSLGARPQHLLRLTLLDSLKPLLWAVLLLAVGYSLLQLSDLLGITLPFAAQLQIAPMNATVALLTVLLLTTLIVLGCVRPLLTKPVVHALRGSVSN